MNYEVGTLVEGTVVEITKFGAFVKIRGGKTGLVHISQISDKYVRDINEHVSMGAKVIAKIISIDDKGRLQLSLKIVTEDELTAFLATTKPPDNDRHQQRDPRQPPPPRPPHSERPPDPPLTEEESFERKMKTFFRQSEDRLLDQKRRTEAKRGGPRKR